MRAFLIGPIALAAVVLVSAGLVSRLDLWSVFAGLIAGGLLALAIIFRDEPPRFSAGWSLRVDDENRTERALKPLLDEGWQKPKVELERTGNDDHVLLGPSGVAYIIESKSLTGRASLEHGVLTERFGDDPVAVRRHDLQPRPDLASRVAAEWSLRKRTPVPPMRTIVVVWGNFLDAITEHDGVLYVAGAELAETLRRMEVGPPAPQRQARWA